MKDIDDNVVLEVLTRMGYIEMCGPCGLKDVIDCANKNHNDSVCRICYNGSILFEGKISNLLNKLTEA